MKKRLLLLLIVLVHIGLLIAFIVIINKIPTASFFSKAVVELQGNSLIHNDSGIPIPIVRFFHNKIVISAFDIGNRYLQYFNPIFVIDITGLLGFFGILLSIKYLLFQKRNLSVYIFALSLIIPFIAVFTALPILVFLLPYYILSIWGYFIYSQLHPAKQTIAVIIVLFILSIMWFLLFKNVSAYMQSFQYL